MTAAENRSHRSSSPQADRQRAAAPPESAAFLTTQYLEEADELAQRVGIIDHGRLVAEGTPAELKRAVGTDVIVARMEGDVTSARSAVASVPGVHGVDSHGNELVIAAGNGSAALSPVAVALASTGALRELTLAHAHARRRVPGAHRQPHRTQGQRGGLGMTAVTTI